MRISDPKIRKAPGPTDIRMDIVEAFNVKQALDLVSSGKHVVIPGDLSIKEEIEVKQVASERGVVVLGPNCPFAVMGDQRFGSWNIFRGGSIALVGTSAIALRALSVLLAPIGVSYVMHVGARDLTQKIGGLGTASALRFLDKDPEIEAVVLVSIAPPSTVERKLMKIVGSLSKKCYLCMPGHPPSNYVHQTIAGTAAEIASAFGLGLDLGIPRADEVVERERAGLAYGQRHIRALYSGRFLCAEAQVLLERKGKTPYSNVPLRPRNRLANPHSSMGHSIIDLSAPELASGTSPSLDPSPIAERILREAKDLGLAAIVFNIELGKGLHPDPASMLEKTVREAKQMVEDTGGYLSVIGVVLGTELDSPSLSDQRKKLEKAGAIVVPSSTEAVELAMRIAGIT
jgi:succinyl-CoA synthetase alpha subunit